MKAFALTARDTQPALQELPQPEPAGGQVLVEVQAAGPTPLDASCQPCCTTSAARSS